MQKFFNKVQYLIILGILFLPFEFLGADGQITQLNNPLGGSGGVNTISQLINSILGVIIIIAAPLAILAIIYSGFLFVKARGNPEKLKEARNTLMWTIIGIIVLLGAQLLSTVISGTITSLGTGV
ncbi:MAG: hypothetical protein KAV41_01060 [Candidatus Pacebacteria bacterium]|nr:hypothetical protein [Candidatus Paceibacterota bacterium]